MKLEMMRRIHAGHGVSAGTLESPVRYESREMTKGLLEIFDDRIHHQFFDPDL